MAMDSVQVRRWLAGFEAIAQADLEALRCRGPDPAQAIGLALSMIEAAEQAGFGTDRAARREAEDAAVRAIWARLRARQSGNAP